MALFQTSVLNSGLNVLDVAVLGYTLNPRPNYDLLTEFKNLKNARKADGAIIKEYT